MDVACKICDGYCQGSCTVRAVVTVKLCRQCGRAYDGNVAHKCLAAKGK